MPGSPAASEQPVAFAASPEGGISLAYTDWPEASELFSWTLGGTVRTPSAHFERDSPKLTGRYLLALLVELPNSSGADSE